MAIRLKSRLSPAQLFQHSLGQTQLPKIFQHPLVRILLAILFLFPAILLNNAFSFLVLDKLNEPLLSVIQIPKAILFLWFLMWSYRQYCRRIEGRNALEFGRTGWLDEFGSGLAIGAGMVAIIVGSLATLNCYNITSVNEPWVLVTRIFRYGQGAFIEDLLFTVIIFRLVEEFAGTFTSFIGVSLLFGLMHLGNDNATPSGAMFIALQQITLLAPFILTRRIWMTWAVHLSWNYSQSAIFGLNNSGMEHGGILSPVVTGPEWFTGGAMGIEGSWLGLAVNLAVGVPLLILAFRRGQNVRPTWTRNSGGK